MIERRLRGLYTLHGFLITLILPLAFLLWVVFWVELLDYFEYTYVNFPLYLLGLVACGLIFFNLYPILEDVSGVSARVQAIKLTHLQILIIMVMFFTVIFTTKDQAISRLFISTFLVVLYGLLLFLNISLPAWLSRMVFKGANRRRCLLVGSRSQCASLEPWLQRRKMLGLDIAGYVSTDEEDDGTPISPELPCLGRWNDLAKIINTQEANQVILLETRQSKDWVREIMQTCDAEGCRILVLNPWSEYFDYPLTSIREGGYTFFTTRQEPLESPFNRLLKRLVDVAIAFPVVCIVLPILIPIVYYNQKKQSPGPIFYSQRRRGFNRQEFTLYKFRSMHVNNGEAIDKQATVNDPRVFKFGNFLRRTSLDELPQFWNVLKGEMSVVGPRPHLPEHDRIFAQDVRVYPQRHFAKPGITGWAQCLGYRGEITNPELLRKRVELDLAYINSWSLSLDIEIIIRTIIAIIRPPKTAY